MKILLYLQFHASRWKRSKPTKAEKKMPKKIEKIFLVFPLSPLFIVNQVSDESTLWQTKLVIQSQVLLLSHLFLSLSHTHISTNFVGEVQQCDIHSEQGLGIGGDPRTPPSSLRSSRLITRHNPNTSGNTSRFSNINNYIYNFNITYH